jgi:uncharacterized MAPEG superfamily protein
MAMLRLLVAACLLAQLADAQTAGVTTRARIQHSTFCLMAVSVALLAITIIVALFQGVTRLLAGGSVPGKLTAREDEAFGICCGAPYDGQVRENRQVLANRFQNIAQNGWELPAVALVCFWVALTTAAYATAPGGIQRGAEYTEKIAQLSLAFLSFRFLYVIAYLAGINFTFFPLRSFLWYAQVACVIAASCLGAAAGLEWVRLRDEAGNAVICGDGVGCVCRTYGCAIGVILGSTAGFIVLAAILAGIILSWKPNWYNAPYMMGPAPMVSMTPPPVMGMGY